MLPSLDELQQIQENTARAVSLEELRTQFDRLTVFRHAFADDFDASLLIADLHDQVLSRARALRGAGYEALEARPSHEPAAAAPPEAPEAELPPDVERIDPKNWQRAIYIGLFFAVLFFAAFFYLIQTARRLNLSPEPATAQTPAAETKPAQTQNTVDTGNAGIDKPAIRVYTDLVPGALMIDDKPSEPLKDGEFTLTALDPGPHRMKIAGASGNAEFSYDVTDAGIPRIQGVTAAANAMAVLVSTENGTAHLVSNAENADVQLDSKPAGQLGPDGLTITDLGKSDHLLQVQDGTDRQRFILTYTAAPTLTVYVKSDPSAGTVVVVTKQDGVDVYVNDKLYRRQTESGQIRIPLKVGDYTVRVHKAGFIDPPPATVTVKKAEETAVNFRMEAAPQIATLQIRGALPGTMVYIDKDFSATAGADGIATVQNVRPGVHTVELRRDQALPKRFERTFRTGDLVLIAGPDATLDRAVVDSSTAAPPPVPNATPETNAAQNYGMQMDGQQVRKGGGFVAYHVPHVSGHYNFAGETRLGGFLKHGKLQWYAGYQDPENYVLFVIDGKHASVRDIHNGKVTEVNRIPFEADSNTWVQVDMAVHSGGVDAKIKTPNGGWQELGAVNGNGRDFTQGKVGFLIPDKEEIAVSNFRFSPR